MACRKFPLSFANEDKTANRSAIAESKRSSASTAKLNDPQGSFAQKVDESPFVADDDALTGVTYRDDSLDARREFGILPGVGRTPHACCLG